MLFVCTDNSARSQMAEVLLRQAGRRRIRGLTARAREACGINPLTVRVLQDAGFDDRRLRSKSVDEFFGQRFDYVITVCDQARQACPVFPGSGERCTGDTTIPSEATGTEEERLAVFRECSRRSGSASACSWRSPAREHGRPSRRVIGA